MKKSQKVVTVLITVLLLASTAMGQETKKHKEKKPAFGRGSRTLGLSAGAGVDYDYYGSYTALPTLAITWDKGIIGNVGPGTIGIGGILAYKSATYTYSDGTQATWANYILGARATYHLTILKDKNNKFDPYAGIMVGFRYEVYSDPYYNGITDPYAYNPVYPVFGFFVGAKYNFVRHFGVFAEVGYDISLVRVGINFNN